MQFEFLEEKKKQTREQRVVPDVCGSRLYGYAESFRELAKSFQKGEPSETLDRRTFFEEERIRENCGVIAGHLCEVAQIMEQAAKELVGMKPLEEKAWNRLAQGLRKRDLILEGACKVPMETGGQLSLCLRTSRSEGLPANVAEEAIEEALGKRYCLSMNSGDVVGREEATFLFVEEPTYLAFTGFARVIKSREEVSGDNYSILQSERGTVTLLLSDGTGSGEKASMGSGFVLDLAEKLLETGYRPDTAMKMVNATAVTKGGEMGHPTLDACRLDLRRGDCMFCKAGGAVSFRKRGEEVEEIVGGQLPLGIFQDLEPQKHYLRLEEGDSVILMTDGVLEAFRDRGYEEAARSCLAGMKDLSPKEMAEKLMQFAIFASEGNVRDDMTILVATLWRNP